MKIDISIIIPCYNSGKYLIEAIESIRAYPGKNYEVIIVDDGSADVDTLRILEELEQKTYIVLRQKNSGPAAARNSGARMAQGEFLLFLDSDNKIRPRYIDTGIRILNANSKVGVVYGNANFFGYSTEPRFRPREFDLGSILFGNYVDMCSVVRKKAWEDVGGLDEDKVLFGHEDWEFWIRVALKGWEFKYVNEVLFDYRIREDSLLHHAQEKERINMTKAYICNKHAHQILSHYKKYYNQFYLFEKRPFRSFLKFFYFRYILRKKYNP